MSKVKVDPKDKVVFISGANRGIGRAIAVEFLEQGARKVYAGARNIQTLDSLKEQYGDRLIPVAVDVTDQQSIQAAAAIASEVDILVNNAGILAPGGFIGESAVESLNQHFSVNVLGLINLTNALVDSLKNSEEAAIVNVSSVAGLANMPIIGTYSASKAAVHSITQSMRGELAADNILVTGVYPGPIDTDMAKGFEMEKDSPENVAKDIVNGLAEGAEDIFPDIMSKQVGQQYQSDPKALEVAFAAPPAG